MRGNKRFLCGKLVVVGLMCCCSSALSFHPIRDVSDRHGSHSHLCSDQNRAILRDNSILEGRTIKFPCYRRDRLALHTGVRGGSYDSDEQRSSVVVVPSYHLLWSPGVWKQIVLSFCGFALVRLIYPPSQNLFSQSHLFNHCSHGRNAGFASNLFHLFVVPMMSSACCSIQLLINILAGAGGCAGFNTYLGPLRPFFIGFLLFSTLISAIPLVRSHSMTLSWIAYTMATWVIGFLPEIVHVWNTQASKQWKKKKYETQSTEGLVTRATVELDIPSMGCVACVNKIDASLRQCAPEKIKEANSWLEENSETGKGGKARIDLALSSEDDVSKVADILVNAVRDAGFETCTLKSIDAM